MFDINSLTLADAIRLVIGSNRGPMPPREVRNRLEELGFSVAAKFKNPMASVHTAIKRMVDSEELDYVEDDDGTKCVQSGPSLKPISEPMVSLDEMKKRLVEVRKNEKPRLDAASRKGQVKTDDAASTKPN